MLILGVDSSSKTASAAVFDGAENKILSEINSGGHIPHSENLLPMAECALRLAGVSVNDIDLFAAAEGPGSFTGIRIGISTIKGLAFGGGNNCIGVSSLLALAYSFAGFESPAERLLILPVIDARRKQVYSAVFESGPEYIKPERVITTEEFERELNCFYSDRTIIFMGDAADLCFNEIKFPGKLKTPEILKRPSAGALCAAAAEKYKKSGAVSAEKLNPAYLIINRYP
ncbi:MAG: tRNA (adenosine(37)-N6)-threonylcarbamoyltransferase complex dimerization subunit type 1 TsaB [Oscillospiraceae bacterium]|nr:tRNA (adenosine(37)-N6)-threonylcarbamoyltransferase complex dimerization subunit type 1 TsaB [Oscillospiraceae bacterium]